MARTSPITPLYDQTKPETELLPYGPPDAPIPVVATFGSVDLEYAALRKGCVLFDIPHRATLRITGDDRLAFLNSMVTQELKGIEPAQSRSTFWLNRKGRIISDLRLTELGDHMLAEVDTHAAAETIESLTSYVIADDVEIADVSDEFHRLSIHGPTTLEMLATGAGDESIAELTPHAARDAQLMGHTVTIERHDQLGEPAIDLIVRTDAALEIYEALCAFAELPALDPETGERLAPPTGAQSKFRMRRTGWLALNIARIESGVPMLNVDFGTTNLPAETGLLDERVSFTKGCYLGQEVVARMHSLGKPKQTLVALRPDSRDKQPITAAQVFQDEDAPGTPVGVVTSSTISPMLGGIPICFAIVKTVHADPGATLRVAAEGELVKAEVQPRLQFWESTTR